MKPIFTVDAGEYLFCTKIERISKQKGLNLRVWLPTKDTGVDVLVSSNDIRRNVAVQVKISRDYSENAHDINLRKQVKVSGWIPIRRAHLLENLNTWWCFLIFEHSKRVPHFINIDREALLSKLEETHGKHVELYHFYPLVLQNRKVFHTRNLNRKAVERLIQESRCVDTFRDYTEYFENWEFINDLR